MTLEEQIARAIHDAEYRRTPWKKFDSLDPGDRDEYIIVAEAVVNELGLRRAEMGEWDVLANGFRGHRYVTDWVDDNPT